MSLSATPKCTVTYIADNAIAAFQVVAKGAGDRTVTGVTVADGAAIGIAQHAAAAGERVSVAVLGPSRAIAGAAIAITAMLAVQGVDGKLKPAAPAAGANSYIMATPLTPASAAGDQIIVNISRSVMQG